MPNLANIKEWKLVHEPGPGPWKFGFRRICQDMQEIGKKLFDQGFMPLKYGAPGTHGCLGARINSLANEFIVTAAGTHKGNLLPADFIWVREVNWDEGIMTVRLDSPDKKPSYDTWFMDGIFKKFPTFFRAEDYTAEGTLKSGIEKRPQVGAVIYARYDRKVKTGVRISFPELKREEWDGIFDAIEKKKDLIVLEGLGVIVVDTTLWQACLQLK